MRVIPPPKPFLPTRILPFLILLLGALPGDATEVVKRVELEEGVYVLLSGGNQLDLEIHPPKGEGYLADPALWKIYRNVSAAAIAFEKIKPEKQREILLTLFPHDMIDARCWTHLVRFANTELRESLWSLSLWITGKGENFGPIMDRNGLKDSELYFGQKILFPLELLPPAMRVPTPKPKTFYEYTEGDLKYILKDGRQYAEYVLKRGESLYSSVVIRFTDFQDNESILEVCKILQRESGIPDERNIKTGAKILIPVDLLSDPFRPKDTLERQYYEELVALAKQDKGPARTRDLEGVVVVLDPGHGGSDPGAINHKYALYEDEINYDVACRIKRLLETTTRAKVQMTLIDPSLGHKPVDSKRFQHDKDEQLLTHPRYSNGRAYDSLVLRWHLANDIYRRERAAGVDRRKIIFTSIHTDALFNSKKRGAMIYLPGARLRRDREGPGTGSRFDRFREVQGDNRYATSTPAERKRDEAWSRNFAKILMEELPKKRIKRHPEDEGPAIRSKIERGRRKPFVPAVLRNNIIPTKILVETANMTNARDCRNLREPKWRQWFAEAYVNALKRYFGE